MFFNLRGSSESSAGRPGVTASLDEALLSPPHKTAAAGEGTAPNEYPFVFNQGSAPAVGSPAQRQEQRRYDPALLLSRRSASSLRTGREHSPSEHLRHARASGGPPQGASSAAPVPSELHVSWKGQDAAEPPEMPARRQLVVRQPVLSTRVAAGAGAVAPPMLHDFAAQPTGLFVSPSALVAVFSTSAMAASLVDRGGSSSGVQPGLVVTVECGGWLRVRDLVPSSNDGSKGMSWSARNPASLSMAKEEEGLVRYQCRLAHGGEATSACWVVPAEPQGSAACVLLTVGLLSGGIACYRVSGESLQEVQAVAWAAVPVVQLLGLASGLVLATSAAGAASLWLARPTGLVCMAQTTMSVPCATAVLSVTNAHEPSDGLEGCHFFANAVPSGYEDELPTGGCAAFLVSCNPSATGEWFVSKAMSAPAHEGDVARLCHAPRAGQLWASTSRAAVLVWDVDSCALLRRIGLPGSGPAHALSLASAATPSSSSLAQQHMAGGYRLTALPETVWVSQLTGEVTAWDTTTFALQQRLTVSYPPLHPPSNKRGGGGASSADTALVVEDAVDLHRALCGPPSMADGAAARHFTVGVTALEPVVMWRTWTAATDGTVRSWLVPSSTTAVTSVATTTATGAVVDPSNPCADGEVLVTGAATPPPLDPDLVREFLRSKAQELAEVLGAAEAARQTHAAEVADLQARNAALTAALKEATSQLQVHAAAAQEREAREEQEDTRRQDHASVQTPDRAAPTTAAAAESPVPPPPLPPSPAANLAQLLRSLQGRLTERIEEQEATQAELLAYRLRSLDDAAAHHDAAAHAPKQRAHQTAQGHGSMRTSRGRHRRGGSNSSSSSRGRSRGSVASSDSASSSTSAMASCSSEDIALVEAWSTTPLPISGAPAQRPRQPVAATAATSSPYHPRRQPQAQGTAMRRGSTVSSPSAFANGSTILAPAQQLWSPY